MYIRATEDGIVFPFALAQLFEEFPKRIFPMPLTDDLLAEYGIHQVEDDAPPALDRRTHRADLGDPVFEGGKWVRRWAVRAATADEAAEGKREFAALVAGLARSIDDAVAARITTATRFAMGYEQREAAALAYRARGYQGDATVWITRFATNVGMTAQAAADLILAQAAGLRAALEELEALRMDKYLVNAAKTVDQANAIAAGVMDKIAAVIIP